MPEKVSCYLCGADRPESWGAESGYEMVRCGSCGLIYMSIRPGLDEIDEASRTGEHRTDRGSLDVTTKYKRRRELEFARILGSVDVGQPKRWLDVGSGHGEMIRAVPKGHPEVTVIGCEPNRFKRASAAERGVDLRPSLAQIEGSFDVISLMNVYSHLPDPVEFLTTLLERLNPDGRILIETGNGAEIERKDYPGPLYLPDHLSFTGEDQLRLLADRVGLKVSDVVRRRVDGARVSAAQTVKKLTGKPTNLRIPYTSPFRSITICFALR